MSWIECEPREATRATINGRVLTRSSTGIGWEASGVSGVALLTRELSALGARFEKEAPKEWIVEFDDEGTADEPYPVADGLRHLVGGMSKAFNAVKGRKYLVRDITDER